MSVPTTCAGAKRCQAKQRRAAQRPRTGRRKTNLRSNWKHQPGKQRTAIAWIARLLRRTKRKEQLPTRHTHQDRAQDCIQQILRPRGNQVFQKQRPDQNARCSSQQHEPQRPPRHVATHNLCGHQDQFHGRRKHQSDPDRLGRGDSKEQHKDRHRNGSCTHTGERNEQCDDESNDVLHFFDPGFSTHLWVPHPRHVFDSVAWDWESTPLATFHECAASI